MGMSLEAKIIDSKYSDCLTCAHRLGYIGNDKKLKLEDLNAVNKNIFPNAYIPNRIDATNGDILYQTYDSVHDVKNSYDIRFLWFSLNGDLYEDSLYEYFTYNNRSPMYMVRVEIDQHFSSVRDISYCVNTQSILTRTDIIDEDLKITIFENDEVDSDIYDKIVSTISRIRFERF